MKPPDVLVLGVGGTLGEAWLSGFLADAGQQGGIDFRQSAHFVGTSAGSIVAARLASGRPPRRPEEAAGLVQQAPPASVSSAARRLSGWPGFRLTVRCRRWTPCCGPRGRPGRLRGPPFSRCCRWAGYPLMTCARVAALGPRFDGRLRVVAVAAGTGHRVVFGAPGAPQADVPDAVAASSAVPGLSARRGSGDRDSGDRDYVDGGVWSPANLDIAPVGPGTRVLCLVPTAALLAGNRIAVRVLARSWQAAITVEAAGARRRGARVTIIGPDAGSNAAMGADLMDASRREQVARAGFAQGMPAAASPAGAGLCQDADLP